MGLVLKKSTAAPRSVPSMPHVPIAAPVVSPQPSVIYPIRLTTCDEGPSGHAEVGGIVVDVGPCLWGAVPSLDLHHR